MRGRCLVPARDVWPREPRRPPQCPLPPAGAGKGRKRRRVGEGHCPHVRSGPAPHCAGGGTLRGPGLGVPRVAQWSLPSPVPPPPRLQDGGQSRGPSPACSWLRTLASTLSPETRVTRLPAPPFPLGALSPSEITDAGGGGGGGGDIPSPTVTCLQSWGIEETGQTPLSSPAPPLCTRGTRRSRPQETPIPVGDGGRGGAEHPLDDK